MLFSNGQALLVYILHQVILFQLLGLHEKHGQNAIVIYIKKGTRNIVTDSYATPGFATVFLGTKELRSESGGLIMDALRGRFEGMLYMCFCGIINFQH